MTNHVRQLRNALDKLRSFFDARSGWEPIDPDECVYVYARSFGRAGPIHWPRAGEIGLSPLRASLGSLDPVTVTLQPPQVRGKALADSYSVELSSPDLAWIVEEHEDSARSADLSALLTSYVRL